MFGRSDKKDEAPELSAGGSIIHRYTNEDWSPTKVGFTDQSAAEFSKAREEVYERRFGKAANVSHEVIPLIPHIDVMEYYRTGANGRVCTLVTSGMSDLAMNVPDGADTPRRVELIFYCTEPKQEYVSTLRFLAHFPHDQKTWIGAYHTIPNGNPPAPLWGTAHLDTILLLPPLVKSDQTLQDDLKVAGEGVSFLWIVPVTTPECKLKLAKGANALLELFSKNRHPYIFDPNRKSYV